MGFISGFFKVVAGSVAGVAAVAALPILGVVGTIAAVGTVVGVATDVADEVSGSK